MTDEDQSFHRPPVLWFGISLLATSYNVTACDHLSIRNDIYPCEVVRPWEPTQREHDAQCARQGNAPSMCVRCDTSLISRSWTVEHNVTLNVTESMLRGHFWTLTPISSSPCAIPPLLFRFYFPDC